MGKPGDDKTRQAACAGVAASLLVFVIAFPLSARAQSLNQTRGMDFGRIALTDYNAVGTLVLDPDGSYSASPEIIVLDPPTPARFEATGMPPNTAAVVSVTNADATLGGSGTGRFFAIRDYVTSPATVVSNGAGNLLFDLGATLSTEGGGQSYSDGNYSANITVTIVL